MNKWFKLRGELDGSQGLILTIIGFFLTLILWWGLAEIFSKEKKIIQGYSEYLPTDKDSLTADQRAAILKKDSIAYATATETETVYPLLPRPDKTLLSFKPLLAEDKLVSNTLHSVWLNLQGYFWAILIAIPLGMLLSLIPLFRQLFARQIDAMRFIPLSALTGLFIIWFGLGDSMKIAFLAVGIIVYLIPVVMQRIYEVQDTYVQTSYTMGASQMQQVRSVYFPAALSSLIDDIRVLTAISWTYIIIAELLNKEAGIGGLIYTKARQGQTDRVFAILIVIILIGLLQDQIFKLVDRLINPHKYYKTEVSGLAEGKIGLYSWIGAMVIGIIGNFLGANVFMNLFAWLLFATGSLFVLFGFTKIIRAAH